MKKSHLIVLMVLLLLTAGCTDQERKEPPPDNLYAGSVQRDYAYTLDGTSQVLGFSVYSGLNDYLAALPRTYQCTIACPSNETRQRQYLDEKYQEAELDKFSYLIKSKAADRENRAKLAISLVQSIPYDDLSYTQGKPLDRYPYQVLYDGRGVCGEKVRLLAYLLRDLGYGTALLYYPKEQHSALGLRCPAEYSHKGTGYCFIETTGPAVPTYDQGEYLGFGKLASSPEVIKLSDGDAYENIGQEYMDAQEWARLQDKIAQNKGVLEEADYAQVKKIAAKYGIAT